MDRSAFPARFLVLVFLFVAGALMGCSGSSGASSSGAGDAENAPPVQQPPDEGPPSDDAPGADSAQQPDVAFSAADPVVPNGGSAVLNWSTDDATACSAGGGWSGQKPVQGSATVGPLSQSTTFTLTCTGDGGNAVAMISVSVLGVVTLEWQAPTENVDGSPLDDLAGYRIYYGELSGSYTDDLPVADDSSTQQALTLPSGSYYFAMTALDAHGNESGYSNEVVKVVN